jgi:hypothetical protein
MPFVEGSSSSETIRGKNRFQIPERARQLKARLLISISQHPGSTATNRLIGEIELLLPRSKSTDPAVQKFWSEIDEWTKK